MKMIRSAALAALLVNAPLSAQRPLPIDTLHVQAGSRTIAGAVALTRSVDVIDRAAIDALPVRTVGDAVARGLGVDLRARSQAQADVSMRGGSFEQVLVLVDGAPVNDLQTGHFHLDTAVPLEDVERIELLRGPAAAVYGSSAVGGVINIVTKRTPTELSARVQGGSFSSWIVSGSAAGKVTDRAALRASAEHDASDGHRPGTDHRMTQLRTAADLDISGGRLSASAAFAARDFGANGFYAPFDSYEETRTATATVAWQPAAASFAVEPRLTYRQHRDDFILRRDDPAFYRNRHTTHLTRAELVARWVATPRLHVVFGGDVQDSRIDSNSLGTRSERAFAAFGEAVTAASGLLVSAGARLDHHDTFGTFVSPSLAAGLPVNRLVRVRASAAGGFRAPSWTDRFYEDPANIGNPDLGVERFVTGEIGAALSHDAGSVDAALFVRRARDLIDWGRPADADPAPPWRTLNVEEATFRGLELKAGTTLASVSLSASGSWIDFTTREQPGLVSRYALQPLIRSIHVEVAAPLSRLRLALRGGSLRRADGESWESLEARASLDAGRVHIFADATNLLDSRPRDLSGQPAAGRAFFAGVRMRR